MEINRFEHEVYGVVPVADIVEGRFGIMVASTHTYDFGSRTDLPGFRVPATAEEAKNARYVLTWAQDNREFPLFQPVPSFTYALRQGWDQSQTWPQAVTMYLTNPAHQESITITSGTPALAFGKGAYTIPSGGYIYAAGITVPGALLQVANTAEDTTDAGKLKLLASYGDRKVGHVLEYVSATGKLTVELD